MKELNGGRFHALGLQNLIAAASAGGASPEIIAQLIRRYQLELQHEKVMEIITALRWTSPLMQKIFCYGSCYQLIKFLRVFFQVEGYQTEDGSHVIAKIGERYYDINGEFGDPSGLKVLTMQTEHELMEAYACLINGNIMSLANPGWDGTDEFTPKEYA